MTRRNLMLFAVTAVMVGCLPDYPSGPEWRRSAYDERGSRGGPGEVPSSDGSGSTAATGPRPEFGTTIRQADPPPPLSGGTITVAPDGRVVVAADPDRDQVYVVDLGASPPAVRTVALTLHDEPGRAAVDSSNRAHVALRRAGAVVTIDLATATVSERRDVCSAPRGITYDARTDVVHVACAEGELVTLPAAGGVELQRRLLPRDLRDVVVTPGGLAVSTFRDAKILDVNLETNAVVARTKPHSPTFGQQHVAWRMVAAPPPDPIDPADVLVAAQKAPDDGVEVDVPPVAAEYYSNGAANPCRASGPGAVVLDRAESIHAPTATLAVDVAATAHTMVLAAAGNGHTPTLPQLVFLTRGIELGAQHAFTCDAGRATYLPNAQVTSVAFALGGNVVVALSREPASLVVVDATTFREVSRVALSTVNREDTGHAIFHSNSGVGVACASCHPDGRDDGHSWRSLDIGPRRTPSLLGTLVATAPYHWNGEAKDLPAIVRGTYQSRMKGLVLSDERVAAMNGWMSALAAMPSLKPSDAAAASRGRLLFEGAGNCTQCHSGAMKTNNETVDAHTGGVFQVPPLVGVAWRSPLLHDGSAPNVRALLQTNHGDGQLAPAQLDDLTAYVETF